MDGFKINRVVTPLPPYRHRPVQNLTVRDWLAGQALAGLLANSNAADGDRTGYDFDDYAEDAYRLADRMLCASGHEERLVDG